jgi:hypothetical protein
VSGQQHVHLVWRDGIEWLRLQAGKEMRPARKSL